MNRLRELAPWQIILIAGGVLLLFAVLSYVIVTQLTTSGKKGDAKSTIPSDLNSKANQEVVKTLSSFEEPKNLPLLSEPLRTPDPNSPSTVNPFTR